MQVEPLTESLPDGRAGDGRFVLVADRSGGLGERAHGRDDLAGGRVGEAVLAWGQPVDDVSLGVHQRVMPFTQRNQVHDAGGAMMPPPHDVMQIGPPGIAAGEAAAGAVALADRPPDRGGRGPGPPPYV